MLVIKIQTLVLNDYIKSEEITQAKHIWLKANQDVLRCSSYFKNLENQLNLFEDEQTLIHSKGRVSNAHLPYDMKYPTMLSRKHRFAELIVWDSHEKVMYRVEKQTLTELWSEYWIEVKVM